MILTPAAAFEALSNVSHISFTLNCGEIYPERLLVCMGVGFGCLPGAIGTVRDKTKSQNPPTKCTSARCTPVRCAPRRCTSTCL